MPSAVTYGLIARSNSPLLVLLVLFLNNKKNVKFVMVRETRELTVKDLNIWQSRTTEALRRTLTAYQCSAEFQSANAKALKLEDINSDETIGVLKDNDINALVNAGTPTKFSQSLIEQMEFGVLNCHPGSLPEFRGSSAVEWALKEKKRIINTVHFMNSELDSGNIIQEEVVYCDNCPSYQEIRSQVFVKGFDLMAEVMSRQTAIGFKPIDFVEQSATFRVARRPISQDALVKIKATLNDTTS